MESALVQLNIAHTIVEQMLLVMESEEGELFELSLRQLKTSGHSLSDAVWKSLIGDYQIFDCQ